MGAIFTNPSGKVNAGSVYAISGADGSTLYRVDAQLAGSEFGRAIAPVGDINGDKVLDFVVGAPLFSPEGRTNAGAILLFSGRDGKSIDSSVGAAAGWRAGRSVTRNGLANFAFGAPSASPQGKNNAGAVLIPSYSPGFMFGEAAGDSFGWSLAGIGDVNGDGMPDIVIGAPGARTASGGNAGRVYVVSSQGSTVLYRLDGDQSGAQFGSSVAALGDVNGDGVADFAVGAPQASALGKSNAGRVFVLSGRDGKLLYQMEGPSAGDRFGLAVARVDDMDSDGHPEVVVGAPGTNGNAGMVHVFSGRDGKKLYEYPGEQGEELGMAVATAGDVNGDGRPDIIAGAYSAVGPAGRPDGRAYVLTSPTRGSTSISFRRDGQAEK